MTSKNTSRFLPVIVLSALALSAFAVGCGGPSEEQREEAAKASKVADNARQEADRTTALASQCRSQIGPYIAKLSELDSRLSVGMSFADYSSKVGDLSVAYSRIPTGKMDVNCIGGPGLPAETAGIAYQDAYDQWNDCISDVFNCSMDAIEPDLQSEWAKATRKIGAAKRELNAIEESARTAESDAKEAESKAEEIEAALE